MNADDVVFSRRYRALIFNVGVTCGLWALVAAGIYVAKEAERANFDRLAVLDRAGTIVGVVVDVPSRTKDDGYVVSGPIAVATADAASPFAVLPVARPARATTVAAAPSRDAVAARQDVAAGTERFDRCSPKCETRDPLFATGVLPVMEYASQTYVIDEPMAAAGENVMLRVGRDVAGKIADMPRATLDTGMSAIGTGMTTGMNAIGTGMSTGMSALDSVAQLVR